MTPCPSLTRTDATGSFTVAVADPLGRQATYLTENQPTGKERMLNIFPDTMQTELLIGTDGSRNTSISDGTKINLVQGPDPPVVAAGAGVPVAVVTGSLMVIAAVSASALSFDITHQVYDKNWDALAYDIGTLGGSALVAGFNGRFFAENINQVPSPKWSLANDWAQRYDPDYPGGSVGKWVGSGPNPGSAPALLAVSGAGEARLCEHK